MAQHIYRSVSEINLHDIIAHLKAGNEVDLVYPNKDILGIWKGNGNYAQIGHVEHLTVSYGEYAVAVELEGEGYWATQTEYFKPDDYECAALAFIKRATYEGHKATNTGLTLEQIAGVDAASIHFNYMMKVDSGVIEDQFEAPEGQCNHCREEWANCTCDGGIGSPFDDDDDPLEQASHALICGIDDCEDPVDISCDRCGEHHLHCICDESDPFPSVKIADDPLSEKAFWEDQGQKESLAKE